MEPSQKCIDLIKEFEGFAQIRSDGLVQSYLCPARVWTIGYGSTGPDIRQNTILSVDQCEELLKHDLAKFAQGVTRAIAGVETCQHEFDAMVSFAFNVGLSAFEKSTLLKRHRAGRNQDAAQQFHRWVYGGGRKLGGLVRRRRAESALYAGGDKA